MGKLKGDMICAMIKAGISKSEKKREKMNAMVRGKARIELKFRENSVYRYLLRKIWLNEIEVLL